MTGLGVGLSTYGVGLALFRYWKNPGRYKTMSTSDWHEYALEREWAYHGNSDKAVFKGVIEGQPLYAEVVIRRIRTRRGGEFVQANSTFRVPIRGLAPLMSIRERTVKNRLLLVASGGRPFATDVLKLDEAFLISGADVDEVVPLVRKPAIRMALEALAQVCPEAVVHERAVELSMDGMLSNPRKLDRTLQTMTAVAAAIELSIPRSDGSPMPLPEPEAPLPTAVESPTQRPVTAVRKRPEPLYVALRQVGRESPQRQAVALQHLRLPPYTVTLEVRSVTEAASDAGTTTGDLQINGVLTRSQWRVELLVSIDQANTVLTLLSGDVIHAECLVEEVRMTRQAVEATATSDVQVVSRGTPHKDALR